MTENYEYVMRLYNWTGDLNGDQIIDSSDSPVLGLPSFSITPDGSGFYELTFAYLTSTTDASDRSFSSYVVDHLDTSGVNTYIQTVVGDVFHAPSSTSFFVDYTDVGKVLIASNGGDAVTADITIGQFDNGSDFFGEDTRGDGFTYNYTTTSTSDVKNNINADLYGKVFFNTNAAIGWTTTSTTEGQPGYWSVIHELGHSLGLKHPYNADGAMAANSAFNDQHFTIMASNPAGWTVNGAGTGYDAGANALYYDSTHPLWAYGLQLLDVAAIQGIYGINYDTRSADTLYDLASIGRDADSSKAFLYTIWDGGGTNVIDTTGFGGAVRVDLRQGEFSSIGSNGNGANGYDPGAGRDIDNVAIAYHTLIQNAITTQDTSVLVGNAWDNVLYAAGNSSKIYSDGIVYNNDAGFMTAISGDTNDPNNSIPTVQNDILIGGLGATTFFSGLGSNVLVAFYDKSVIDSATSSWTTYWDAAGQFTGTHNATGSALPDLDPGSTGYVKTADYSQLDAAENVTLAGGTLHIEVTVSSSYITVNKDTASACVGTDLLYGVNAMVGTDGDDAFSGTNGSSMVYFASKGSDTYSVSAASLDYSSLNALSTHAHITVTASSAGVTIDKTDDSGSLGEDTASADVNVIQGTNGDDSFSGFVPGHANVYQESAGHNSYSFDMTSFGTATNSAYVTVYEGSSGSRSDISVSHADITDEVVGSFSTWSTGMSIEFAYGTWNSAISAYDDLYVTFIKTISGPNVEAFSDGGTNYEFGSYYSDIITGASGDHVIDGGLGTNTLDYSAAPAGATVNIATGTASNGWGYTDTFTNLQNVIGSSHNDTITGDSNNNVIEGGAGNNILNGGSGADTLDYSHDTAGVTVNLSTGTATNGYGGTDTISNFEIVTGSHYDDSITGNSSVALSYANAMAAVTIDLSAGTAIGDGSDTISNFHSIVGSAFDDLIINGGGSNTYDGGGGTNTLSYGNDPAGITVDLLSGTATNGSSGTDTLLNIQNVIGSAYDDTITGGPDGSVISGGAGNNTIDGGGYGISTLDYSHDPASVTIDLSAGTATNGYSGTDTFSNIQNVTGSNHGDIITTSTADNNVITCGAGDDLLIVAGSGYNIYDGGGGSNTISWELDPGWVYVDMSSGAVFNNFGGVDIFSNFQNVIGSASGDVIFGDSNNNVIQGGAGDNNLDGGGGTNTLDYSHDPGSVYVDLADDFAYNGYSGMDSIANFQNVLGSAYDDTILGNNDNNVISGGAGNNIIDGGGGVNTIDYSHDPGSVSVDLSLGSATNGYSGTDTLSNVQTVIGSHYNDSITGDGSTTVSYETAPTGVTVDLSMGTSSGDGSDTLSGIANVTGSSHGDTITGDSNDNILYGNGGNDYLTGGTGADTFLFKGATALTGVTTIADFNTGEGDKIDINDVLQGHYDPVSDAIANFVSLTTSGSDTLLKVDLDGTGGTYSPTTVAVIHGLTGLDLATLISNGNLVVPT